MKKFIKIKLLMACMLLKSPLLFSAGELDLINAIRDKVPNYKIEELIESNQRLEIFKVPEGEKYSALRLGI